MANKPKIRVKPISNVSIEAIRHMDHWWFIINYGHFCTFNNVFEAADMREKFGGLLFTKSSMIECLMDINEGRLVVYKQFYNPQQI